jgi:uncharacterized membrane protein YhiD involved in acid resistance
VSTEVLDIAIQLVAAGFLGACIGFERRIHHKAIGIAGMVLIAIGSTTYMLRADISLSLIQVRSAGHFRVSYLGSASSAALSFSRGVST